MFAAGDIVRGASLVVWGIRDGRDAAEQMHRYLRTARRRGSLQSPGGIEEGQTARDGLRANEFTEDSNAQRRASSPRRALRPGRGARCLRRRPRRRDRRQAARARSCRRIEALKAVWHRGAVDADGKTGDGAGIHLEIPQDFFREHIERTGHEPIGALAVGMVFLPRHRSRRAGALPHHRRDRDPELRLSRSTAGARCR